MAGPRQKPKEKKLRKWFVGASMILLVAAVFPLVPLATDLEGVPYDIGFFGGIPASGETGAYESIPMDVLPEGELDMIGSRLIMDCGCELHSAVSTSGYLKPASREYSLALAAQSSGIVIVGGNFAAYRSGGTSVHANPAIIIDLSGEEGGAESVIHNYCTCPPGTVVESLGAPFRSDYHVCLEPIDTDVLPSAPIYMTLAEYYAGEENTGIEIKCTCDKSKDPATLRGLTEDRRLRHIHFDENGNLVRDDEKTLCICGAYALKESRSLSRGLEPEQQKNSGQKNNSTMTRGMFLKELAELDRVNVQQYTSSIFRDVNYDSEYMPYVVWAAKVNLVTGIGGSLFAPEEPITREQMAVILYNYANVMELDLEKVKKARTFQDEAQIHDWAREGVRAMQKAGVILGREQGLHFDPTGEVTVSEAKNVMECFLQRTHRSSTEKLVEMVASDLQ